MIAVQPRPRWGGESVLYPGNSLKEDKHYFTRAEYDTEGETARQSS